MREDKVVVILHTRKYLEEHGFTTKVYDDNPSLEGIPVLATKSAQTVYIRRKSVVILHEYMIKELYKEDEARELFPEAFI